MGVAQAGPIGLLALGMGKPTEDRALLLSAILANAIDLGLT